MRKLIAVATIVVSMSFIECATAQPPTLIDCSRPATAAAKIQESRAAGHSQEGALSGISSQFPKADAKFVEMVWYKFDSSESSATVYNKVEAMCSAENRHRIAKVEEARAAQQRAAKEISDAFSKAMNARAESQEAFAKELHNRRQNTSTTRCDSYNGSLTCRTTPY